MQQSEIQHEAGMNDATNILTDLANFCRDVCEVDLETNPSVIGGINVDGKFRSISLKLMSRSFFIENTSVGSGAQVIGSLAVLRGSHESVF